MGVTKTAVLLGIALINLGNSTIDTYKKFKEIEDLSNNFRNAECIGSTIKECPKYKVERISKEDIFKNEINKNLKEIKAKSNEKKLENVANEELNIATRKLRLNKVERKTKKLQNKVFNKLENVKNISRAIKATSVINHLVSGIEISAPYDEGGIAHPLREFFRDKAEIEDSQKRLELLIKIKKEHVMTLEQNNYINTMIRDEKTVLNNRQNTFYSSYREALTVVKHNAEEEVKIEFKIKQILDKSRELMNNSDLAE